MARIKVTTRQIQLLQIARRDLGMEEQDYRNTLGIYGGVGSSKQLDQEGFERIMTHLKSLGFTPQLKPREKKTHYPDEPPSVAQNKRIMELYKKLGWGVERFQGFHKKNYQSLWPKTREQAQKLIETLKGMEARGYGERTPTISVNG